MSAGRQRAIQIAVVGVVTIIGLGLLAVWLLEMELEKAAAIAGVLALFATVVLGVVQVVASWRRDPAGVPVAPPASLAADAGSAEFLARTVPAALASAFLPRVIDAIRSADDGSVVTRIADTEDADSDMDLLRVVSARGGQSGRAPVVKESLIGVCDRPATGHDVYRLLQVYSERFGEPDIDIVLIYGGPPADGELRRNAAREGVRLVSFVEYKVGYDLRPYAEKQFAQLAADLRYPSGLYVPQRYSEIDVAGLVVGTDERQDLLSHLLIWLDELTGPFVVVLGSFGCGKSYLLREVARHLHNQADAVVPVLLQVRDLKRLYPADELVVQQVNRLSDQHISRATARELLRNGRIALLVDGFDELAMRVSHQRAADQLQAFADAADGQAKVIIVGREDFFRTDSGGMTGLGDRLNAIADRRVVSLAEFNDEQILAFLVNRLGDMEAAQARLSLVRGIEDFAGLARNPRMLDFIARVDETRLRSAGSASASSLSTALYHEVLDQWLDGEQARFAQAGAEPLASKELLWRTVTDLAERIWRSPDRGLAPSELDESADVVLGHLLRQAETGEPGDDSAGHSRRISRLIGSGTLLIRGQDGRFRFMHHSVLEWLIARRIHILLAVGDAMPWPLRDEVGRLVIRFVCGFGPREIGRWAEAVLDDRVASSAAVSNALEVAKVLGLEARGPAHLSGKDLTGEDFSGRTLQGAQAHGADLTEANLSGSDLAVADLTGAFLVRSRLNRAKLRAAVLRNADLTGARLLGADLTGADLSGVSARRAALVGAIADAGAFAAGDFTGAALPGGPAPVPQFRPSASAATAPVAVDDRGGLVAAGGSDGTIRIWDTGSGELIRVLAAHTGATHSVAFAASTARLASAGEDGTVRLWSSGSGELLRELAGNGRPVYSVAVGTDGEVVVAGGQDGSVRRWNPDTGHLTTEVAAGGGLWSVALSPTGHFAAAGAAGAISFWSPDGGPDVLPGNGSVWSLAFSPDGALLAAGGDDGTVRTWSTTSLEPRPALLDATMAIWSVAMSPKGLLAAGGADGTVRLWDVSTGRLVRSLGEHNGPVWSIAFAPDGQWLATSDGTIRIWSIADGRLIRHLTGGNNPVRALSFSSGDVLASTGDDRTMRLWSVRSGRCVWRSRGRTGAVRALALSPDGRRVAGAGGKVHIIDVDTGAVEEEFSDFIGPVRAVAFSPDGRVLASGAGTVRITELASRQSRDLTGHTGSIRALAFSPDGARLASAGDDSIARIWDARSGEVVMRLPGVDGSVRAVAFSPTGKHLVTADTAIRLWDTNDGSAVLELPGHGAAVHAVAFTPDGLALASVGADQYVRLWDLTDGRPIGRLVGHAGPIWSVTFLGDQRWLASAGDDGTIRVWDRTTQACRQILMPLADNGWMAIAADGRYKVEGVLTGEYWLTINMCRFEPGELDPFLPHIERVAPDTKLVEDWL